MDDGMSSKNKQELKLKVVHEAKVSIGPEATRYCSRDFESSLRIW